MKKLNVIIVAALATSTSVYAAPHQCVSTDTAHTLKVILDKDASTITVNGEKRSVHIPTPNGDQGVMYVSDPYETNLYGKVFISVSKNKDGKLVISQIGTKDQAVKVSFTLDCK